MFATPTIPYKQLLSGLALLGLMACNNNKNVKSLPAGTDSSEIEKQIIIGKKYTTSNQDSLKIVFDKLYALNKKTGDKKALVYAQKFESEYYWQNSDHKKSTQFAVKSLATAQQYKITKPIPDIYYTIANLNKETTNYKMAFEAADSGLDAAKKNRDTAEIISGLGLKAMFTRGMALRARKPKSDTKSIVLNLAALKMAESSPKYERIRIRFYNNIGQYYKDVSKLDSTFFYVNKAIALANKYNQPRSLTYSYAWLGQATYYKGQHKEGVAHLNKAIQVAQNLNQPFRVMEIYEHLYDCFISTGNYKEAMHYFDRSKTMRDSLKVLDNVKQISELQVKYESAQKDKEISALSAKAKIEAWQRNTSVVVLILISIIGALIYIKEKKNKKLLLADKQLVDEELRNATLELNHFAESLRHKNELIEEFKAQIEQLHLQHINKADIENLEALMKAHIMTDENWDSFKKLFIKVHGNFFETVKKRYPSLTANDNRMLSLIKMQLGNNEMANMLGVTIEGVKKSKQRLRKKMSLGAEENLNEIITAL